MRQKQEIERAALREAATWSARLAADDVTEVDWRAFEAWLARPKNREAYAVLEGKLVEIEDSRATIRQNINRGVRRSRRSSSPGPRTFLLWAGGLAAVAGALAVAAIVTTSTGGAGRAPLEAEATIYSAPLDQTRTVAFADGSSATLNHGASLSAQFANNARNISLLSGEVSFTVEHDAVRPFSVRAGAVRILDLGTEFNVMSAADAVVVTVRSGSVRIELPGEKLVDLRPGAQLSFDPRLSLATVSQVNPEDAFAWMSGRLVFRNGSLREVVAQMNRYGEKQINLAAPALADLRFSGVLVIGASENMVSQLEALLPVQADVSGEAINLRAR